MTDITLNSQQVEQIMHDNLLNTLQDIEVFFRDNEMRKQGTDTKFPPMYSYDYKTEKRYLKKMKRQFNAVYNWYTGKTFEGEQ